MKTEIGDLLRRADPLAREGGLPEADASRMRQVLSRVRAAPRPHRARFSALAGGMVLATATAIVCVILSGRIEHTAGTPGELRHESPVGDVSATRQLQFSAGGTRVIWTFDNAFEAR